MRCVLSFPGNMDHAQQAALALADADALEMFVTAFSFREDGALASALRLAPSGLSERVRRELRRRGVTPDLQGRIRSYGRWEVLRTLAAKARANDKTIDRIWNLGAQRFDAYVARTFVPRCDAVVAFEYTALASFTAARDRGVASVLHLPSLDSRAYKAIEERERAEWPELARPTDSYFDAKFEERYQRRCDEIALADVIIANSSLTKRSHVAAGADPAKIVVASLGAPPPVPSAGDGGGLKGPLQVLWSGPFTLRKGAHYLLNAWRMLNPRGAASLRVYGVIGAPDRLMATAPEDVRFMGSVPRPVMLDAFQTADVLVFPTLSDGFGMVVTEALSRGVPVITTDQAGAADLIEHGVNGLIIPAGDPAALRDAIQWCMDNRVALAGMREAALATARRHQWSDYRREVVRVMDEGLVRAGYAPTTPRPA